MQKMLRDKKIIIAFLLPALIVFVATVLVPIVWSSYYSVFSWNGIMDKKFIGIDNFVEMFSDKYFVGSWVNNVIYMVINVIGQLFMGTFVAVLLTKVHVGREVFKTLYFAPAILSTVALGQVFQKFYS